MMRLITTKVILLSLDPTGQARLMAGLGIATAVLGSISALQRRNETKVTGHISGNDIYLSSARTQQSQSSMGGKFS